MIFMVNFTNELFYSDYSNQCCLNCEIAPANTICRPAISECDSAEFCTGKNSSCPVDIYDKDGSSCASGTMKCASGICTSRDQQCMARGLRQNISEQCSFQQDSCLISCTDPKDSRNCLMLSGMFLDGTECGLAGFCEKGNCMSTGALNTIKAWTAQNKSIAIPVYLFGSIGIILIIGWITWYFRRRYKRKILLAEKDKDSRPTSVISYKKDDIIPPKARRDSQIVPFPNISENVAVAVVANENIELDTLSLSEHNSNHSGSNNSRRGTGGNPFLPTNNETVNSLGTHRRGKSFGFTS